MYTANKHSLQNTDKKISDLLLHSLAVQFHILCTLSPRVLSHIIYLKIFMKCVQGNNFVKQNSRALVYISLAVNYKDTDRDSK